MTEQTAGISRRTIAKGAAWAVPVVAVAAAAPAMAASGGPPTFTPGTACKNPGNSCAVHPKGYTLPFTVTNSSPRTIYITAVTYENVVGTSLTFVYAPPPTLPITLLPGSSQVIKFNAESTNSANSVFTMDMVITWGHESDGSDHDHSPLLIPISIPGTPPDCTCP